MGAGLRRARQLEDQPLQKAMSDASIWLILGIQASGKSTVADLLASRFDRAVHVRGGQFYRWAVRGWAHPDKPMTPEAQRHLDLRYRLSAIVAGEYREAGFTTIVQDNMFGRDVTSWLGTLRAPHCHVVVLRPSLDVVALRDRTRRTATGKVAYGLASWTIQDLDRALEQTPKIGLWLDTSDQTPHETVDEILRRRTESLVELPLSEPSYPPGGPGHRGG